MNVTALSERLGLEKDEFLELVELFLETGKSDLGQLKVAVQTEDIEEVVKSSHSIKGASGNLGFMEIFEVAKDVELNARQDRLDGASEAVDTIKKHLDQIAIEITGETA
ncbi:MAG: Hpt domain-containing protein [Deltaproteobacteria bacterium]|nr:Hpt domain-containing protein [Deltaproteobacteria bacterium]